MIPQRPSSFQSTFSLCPSLLQRTQLCQSMGRLYGLRLCSQPKRKEFFHVEVSPCKSNTIGFYEFINFICWLQSRPGCSVTSEFLWLNPWEIALNQLELAGSAVQVDYRNFCHKQNFLHHVSKISLSKVCTVMKTYHHQTSSQIHE